MKYYVADIFIERVNMLQMYCGEVCIKLHILLNKSVNQFHKNIHILY